MFKILASFRSGIGYFHSPSYHGNVFEIHYVIYLYYHYKLGTFIKSLFLFALLKKKDSQF